MLKILMQLHDILWGPPMLVLILGMGIYLSVIMGLPQITMFPSAVRQLFRRNNRVGAVTPLQALCTALAGTIGTGNLVGVAGAICIGGPGALFWMWICGLTGMVTKYAEIILAVRFRQGGKDARGGPMYVISSGMGSNYLWMARAYCLFGVIAACGIGNATQINAIITGINSVLPIIGKTELQIRSLLIGTWVGGIAAWLLLGGAPKIGRSTEKLVPAMTCFYLLCCTAVLIHRAQYIYTAFRLIFIGAFSPVAATGGIIGSVFRCISTGCSRGIFTNEAGMGTSAIAHASAEVAHPVEQGLLGLLEVFLDTIVICTMTGLVIICSGAIIPYGKDVGAELTLAAFSKTFGKWAPIFLSATLSLFAFATILSWGLYGARCAEFLFGKHAWCPFALLEAMMAIPGALLGTGTVWLLAETVNGLMIIPNLISLAVLSPELRRLTTEYKNGGQTVNGGTNANFNQCKPL